MKINYINNSREQSWASYKKYLEPILDKTLTLTDTDKNVEVSVVLVHDEDIHVMNRDFRNIDRPTDVLSFEDHSVEDGVHMLGDIVISVDAIRRQAEDYGHSLKREFCFLVTHGYLHLLGYDHMTPEDEAEMFGLQERILDEIARKSR